MNRATPMAVLAAAQVFVSAASAAFAWRVVPSLRASYEEAGQAGPLALRLAAWPLGAMALAAVTVSLAAALARGPRGPRMRAMATALVLSGMAFVGLALSSLAPLLGG